MEQPNMRNDNVNYIHNSKLISVDQDYGYWVVYHGYDGFDYIDEDFLAENDIRILQTRVQRELDKLQKFTNYLSGIITSRGGDRIEETSKEEGW